MFAAVTKWLLQCTWWLGGGYQVVTIILIIQLSAPAPLIINKSKKKSINVFTLSLTLANLT